MSQGGLFLNFWKILISKKTARGLGLGGVPAFLTWHIYTVWQAVCARPARKLSVPMRMKAHVEGISLQHALIVRESHAFCEQGPS